ncbi:MAG TPA: S8 family serine peptidase, partial [Acidimicrobiia bacterium]
PYFPYLWGLRNTGQTGGTPGADIHALQAWNTQTGSSSVVVAVIDTGVAYTHPDLAANMWVNTGEIPGNGIDDDGNGYVDDVYGYDFVNHDGNPFDDHGHGTHVAGTIAGVGNNGIGVVGVNWHARIMALKFLGASGSGSTSDAVSAVLYAANMHAKVMNNSWGGGGFSQALMDAITTANSAGSLFVAAAGNFSDDNDVFPNYPSNYDVPNVVAVAATDHNDALATFSNYGHTTVDLGAPGVNILSTVPTSGGGLSDPSGYRYLSGTSMATPHVSGAAALLFAQFPGITHLQVKDRLLNGVDHVPSLAGITVTGGRLNVLNALETDTVPPAPVTDLSVAATHARSATLTWSATGDDGMTGTATRYDLRYATFAITDANFASATPVASPPAPASPGTVQSFQVKALLPSTTYYFAMKVVDNVGNLSGLSVVASTTTAPVTTVFEDDLSTSSFWTVTGTNGVGGPALWHLSSHRVDSPPTAFYYGREDTLTYATGARNFGAITSSPISLCGVSEAAVSFQHFLQTENLDPYDRASVSVSKDDGVTWTPLYSTSLGTAGMVPKTLDLVGLDGEDIRLRFDFDTVDAFVNDFEGWVVDDVSVTGRLATFSQPPRALAGGPYGVLLGQ